MIVGSLLNASYVFCYINPSPALLYSFSAISGMGGTLLWIAQGSDLTLNSTEKTIARNWSIFFAMFMSGSFGGNLYVYFSWKDIDIITESTQVTVSIVLGVITVVGRDRHNSVR